MIGLSHDVQIWLCAGFTDLRKGFDGLAAIAQHVLHQDPFSGHLFVFRGKRGDKLKILWWDGQGYCLFYKRLEQGRFVWPQTKQGEISLSMAQLSMLLEGIDWRQKTIIKRPVFTS